MLYLSFWSESKVEKWEKFHTIYIETSAKIAGFLKNKKIEAEKFFRSEFTKV